ncbi:tRNA(Ile)-lysidine synthase [Metamycoplasma subdolum]|uniref:tRNA(Ile)-lysidine synthase n=1 Tax=Metamycoplasma subdolum TaxID=92407 RepID=A0A3M0A1L8_9BACT|nr:tRNA lysidine(34) synthetase TilS [Metamycoplasma subdolum]RMA78537.1 tRNA(Ile)-lysidine synthase [Metamycoplasma subdolum]WPB50469.1 tRNA lysidine(34) synthetase TilS [Metamycoplasma subdolum]
MIEQLKKEFIKFEINLEQRFILGISGGPDSMCLLNLMKDQNIVVAHVNYMKRKDSYIDQEIVENYCKKYSIPCFVKTINDWKNYKGNFQTVAREIRYDYYLEIAQKFNSNIILLAHQKDDFLEQAIMQENSKRNPLFFGIKQINKINNLTIFRPLINLFWKVETEDYCKKNDVKFAVDFTNDLPIYTRNKIRLELKNWTVKNKQNKLDFFKNKNLENEKIETLLSQQYEIFKSSNFDLKTIEHIENKELFVFKLINANFPQVKLTSGKIKSLCDFLWSKNSTKQYKLNDNYSLVKKRGKLIF